MVQDSVPPAEKPRTEPEIIPPGSPDPRWVWSASPPAGLHGKQRIYVARLGPFGTLLVTLAIALVAALLLVTVVGAVLIGFAVVILSAIAILVSAALRRRQ